MLPSSVAKRGKGNGNEILSTKQANSVLTKRPPLWKSRSVNLVNSSFTGEESEDRCRTFPKEATASHLLGAEEGQRGPESMAGAEGMG